MSKDKLAKFKAEISSELYYEVQYFLGILGSMYMPCHSYFYFSMRFECADLLKKKFLKLLSTDAQYTEIKLNIQEAVPYYYCLVLNEIRIELSADVHQYLGNNLSEHQLIDLNKQIAYIKEFYDFLKEELHTIQSANQDNNLLEI